MRAERSPHILERAEPVQQDCLVLSPHIDDAAFSLSGFLAGWRFRRMIVLNVFTVSNYLGEARTGPPEEVTRIRIEEDNRCARELGLCAERIYLGRLDAPLRLSVNHDLTCHMTPGPDDASEIATILGETRRLVGDKGLVLVPMGLGGHVDHLVVAEAGMRRLRSGHPTGFYEELPYASSYSMAEIVAHIRELELRAGEVLNPCIALAEDLAEIARVACDSFASQVEVDTIDCLMGHATRLGVHGVPAERIWLPDRAASLLPLTKYPDFTDPPPPM